VSKATVIDHVFPDMPFKNASLYLNTALYQLRMALAPHGYKHIAINSQRKYRLLFEQMDVDYIKFEDAVKAFTDVVPWEKIDETLACEALYTGRIYEHADYGWAASEQARTEQLHTQLCKKLIRQLLHGQRAEHAASLAHKLIARNELDEDAHLMLVQSYLAMNDTASAKRHYARFSEIYEDELGLPLPPAASQIFAQLHSRPK